MEPTNTNNSSKTPYLLTSGSPPHVFTEEDRQKGGSACTPAKAQAARLTALRRTEDAGKTLTLSQKIISDPSVSAETIINTIMELESRPGLPTRERTRLIELRLRLHEAAFGKLIRQFNANMDVDVREQMAKWYDIVNPIKPKESPPEANTAPQGDDNSSVKDKPVEGEDNAN